MAIWSSAPDDDDDDDGAEVEEEEVGRRCLGGRRVRTMMHPMTRRMRRKMS